MRVWMLGLVFLYLPAVVLAQKTKAPAAGKDDPRLDRLLREWDSKARDVRDMECEFRRIIKEKLFKTEKVEYGEASAIRPYRARLDLRDEQGNYTEIFIYTGKRLYHYDFQKKQEIITNLPEPKPGDAQALPGAFGFLSGMTAAEAKARFDLTLIGMHTKGGTEYAEIHAVPRTSLDQQDFKLAQILIDTKTFLPKELKLVEPNGNEMHWIFDRLDTNLNPPVSGKQIEPFDRKVFKELQKWEQILNNYAEPPKSSDSPKAKSASGTGSQPEARRQTPKK